MTPSLPLYLATLSDALAELTGDDKYCQLSSLCKLAEVSMRHGNEDWSSSVVETVKKRAAELIDTLDPGAKWTTATIKSEISGIADDSRFVGKKADRVMDLFHRTEDKLKVEMMTALMTLKTHSRLATMKYASISSVHADLSRIEHIEDTGRDSHHNYEQILNKSSQISNMNIDQKNVGEDVSLSHSQMSQLQDHSEIEEFLRYEAEISDVLKRARNSQQKRSPTEKTVIEKSSDIGNFQADPDNTLNLSRVSNVSVKHEDKKTTRNSASEKIKKLPVKSGPNGVSTTQRPPMKPPQGNRGVSKGR